MVLELVEQLSVHYEYVFGCPLLVWLEPAAGLIGAALLIVALQGDLFVSRVVRV